jgi:hypothetical protein
MRKMILVLGLTLAGVAACDSSPSAPGVRPQFDSRGRPGTTTMTTTTRTAADSTGTSSDSTAVTSGGQIGDPCDPETYAGPYRCVPDPNVMGGYVIAY